MKVGIVADVHANWHALLQVLQELDQIHGVALTVCAGDLVCYGAYPNEVVDLLRERSVACVCGNYDEAVAWGRATASRRPSSPGTEPLKRAALAWTTAQLGPRQQAYLRSLPWAVEFHLNGVRLLMLHAGRNDLDEVFDPNAPGAMALLTTGSDADITVLGHTHHAYTQTYGSVLLLNPGAVGRSLDRDTRASYAVLDTDTRQASIYRAAYDVEAAATAIECSGMPIGIALLVRHGVRRLEELPI